jgi:hypothetical protein
MATLSNKLGARLSKNEDCIYECTFCDYKCCKKFNYDRHILSLKHMKATKINKMATQNEENEQNEENGMYCCNNCGKEYNDRTGLWRHKKKHCGDSVVKGKQLSELNKDELIIALLKQNAELIKGQQDMFVKLTENGINNNSNNTTTNSHNKAFNLQFFLNETCKNAMNITDFIDSIKLQLNDLMEVGEIGYVDGISKIIVKNLNNLDETERPIHCTDKKRETMYIKDDDKWEKEDDNKTKLKKAINRIADKNIRLLPQFREKYPNYSNSSSKMSDKYDKLVIEVMETDENKKEKIIKNISVATTIKS